jgi:hypothetical protein
MYFGSPRLRAPSRFLKKKPRGLGSRSHFNAVFILHILKVINEFMRCNIMVLYERHTGTLSLPASELDSQSLTVTGDPRWPAHNGFLGSTSNSMFLPGLSTFGTLAVRKELGSGLGANWGSGTLSAHWQRGSKLLVS